MTDIQCGPLMWIIKAYFKQQCNIGPTFHQFDLPNSTCQNTQLERKKGTRSSQKTNRIEEEKPNWKLQTRGMNYKNKGEEPKPLK